MTKEKLIEQYEYKIKYCDKLLKHILDKKRVLRNYRNKSDDEYSELCSDRKMIAVQRQCYIQFISDIEYELD